MHGQEGLPTPGLQTCMLHADHPNVAESPNASVAPTISVTSTFRAPHPDSELARKLEALPQNPEDPGAHVYSRYTQGTTVRTEKVLSSLLNGYALTYSSGMQAATSALNYYLPSVIAIRRGYQGVHEAIELYKRDRDVKIIDIDDEYPSVPGRPTSDDSGIREGGLLVWIETPLNPTGEARDLSSYCERAHSAKGYVVVDSTFAPPPLQDPFAHRADMVLHSATKYMGGHSDLLAGVLAVQGKKQFQRLWHLRTYAGTNVGSFESYLLLRSLRSMPLRVKRQSETAGRLVEWLHTLTEGQTAHPSIPPELTGGKVIVHVFHSTLQPRKDAHKDPTGTSEASEFDPSQQMPLGGAPTFSVVFANEKMAKYFPHNLAYFTPATSLGGVESLVEQRITSNPIEDPRLVRLSTGLEDFDDLKADIIIGMKKVL